MLDWLLHGTIGNAFGLASGLLVRAGHYPIAGFATWWRATRTASPTAATLEGAHA